MQDQARCQPVAASGLWKSAVVAIFNLAKLAARLLTAHNFTTCVANLRSRACDPAASLGGAVRLVPLAEAAPWIRDGDLLLWRRRGLIAIAGRGRHSHAAKAAWWDDDLFCLEMRELVGGRAVTLASQVRRAPGRIDLYETNPDNRWPHYDRAASTRAMRRKAGEEYGYRGIVRAALLHLPLVRIFARPSMCDAEQATPAAPEFCSQACASADRLGGGVDPVPNLGDRQTEPADLARSPFYRYRCTLLPALFAMLLGIGVWLASGQSLAQSCVGGACPPAAPHQRQPAPPGELSPAGAVRLQYESVGGVAHGSGTIIEVGDRGIAILSCAHLLDDRAGRLSRLTSTGHSAPVELIAIDRRFDLSLLYSELTAGEHIATASAVPIADKHPPSGMAVSSGGFGPSGQYRSVAGRVLGYARTGGEGYETLVVSGAARPGDSGGAILNPAGELVAVLWGTDRTRIVGTYCGRIHRFLAAARERLAERLAPRPPPDTPHAAPRGAVPTAPSIPEGIAARAPDLLFWMLSLAGVSLSPWAVLGLRLWWKVHRRRRARKRSAASVERGSGPLRNDHYAEQLNELMQTFGGRNTVQDATLGREYDRLLAEAETSSDAAIGRFAQRLRQQARTAFERIHAAAPLPAEPAA